MTNNQENIQSQQDLLLQGLLGSIHVCVDDEALGILEEDKAKILDSISVEEEVDRSELQELARRFLGWGDRNV